MCCCTYLGRHHSQELVARSFLPSFDLLFPFYFLSSFVLFSFSIVIILPNWRGVWYYACFLLLLLFYNGHAHLSITYPWYPTSGTLPTYLCIPACGGKKEGRTGRQAGRTYYDVYLDTSPFMYFAHLYMYFLILN
ncbi:hypothetical protein QBC37DRAFT_153320 [Rhypophila decipiens]|uniref:Uncharacterized protein n=1 Tax=Rhypophila decipiens TaxID=261697 RepID=A0AAN6YID0_9PEZI|nr:hypothetical protein QBC37DRAFT_153320 [Rhypophila decipiens]